MDKTALGAALGAALVTSTAGADNPPPPMGIMGPYDTPAMAADRISVPENPGDLGAQRGESGLENAAAAPPEGAGLLDLTGGNGRGDASDLLDLADGARGDKDDDKGDKDDKDNDRDDGEGDDKDDDKDDDRDSDRDDKDGKDDDRDDKDDKDDKGDDKDGDG